MLHMKVEDPKGIHVIYVTIFFTMSHIRKSINYILNLMYTRPYFAKTKLALNVYWGLG